MNQFEGWINVYKPNNISSFDVIKKIKSKFKILKIGHAGTLDPSAEGILPIAIGKTTKLVSLINDQKKTYEFEIKWGEQTTTDDNKGEIIYVSKNIPSREIIENQLPKFIGDILQKPPKVSAVKINGKRAYKRFRDNETFETKERFVKVYSLKFIDQSNNTISKIGIECGKGFYVRSFARDLGESLNTKAHIYSLKRTKVGKFTLENSILLDDLLKISEMTFGIRGLHSSASMLNDILVFEVDTKEMLTDISHGKVIQINNRNLTKSLNKSDNKLSLVIQKDKIVSLGKFDGKYFKPEKVLI